MHKVAMWDAVPHSPALLGRSPEVTFERISDRLVSSKSYHAVWSRYYLHNLQTGKEIRTSQADFHGLYTVRELQVRYSEGAFLKISEI